VVAASLPIAASAQASPVAWRPNLDSAKVEAATNNKLLLIHFWTPSGGPCQMLEREVFSQPHVCAAIEQEYVPVKIDADSSPAMAAMFRIEQVPTDIVMTPQGNVVATLPSPQGADAYLAQLQNLARHFRQTTAAATTGESAANINPA